MKGLLDFALYNLAGSLMAGLLAWMMVMAALRLLSVRTPFLYASFLALPLVKSGLVLLGIGLVFPWGGFAAWQQRAVSPGIVLPFVLLWFGLALAAYYWLVARARADVLRHASPPPDRQEDRLQGALDRIAQAYRQTSCCEAGETVCCIADQVPANPRLLVSDWLRSPAALVEGGTPVILFPKALVELLDDHELTLALAHELNHFALRKPGGWSAGNLRILALVSPVALLLADELSRAEEKACDDLAVRILGMPEVYAGMLMKSYQFSRTGQAAETEKRLWLLPQLMGTKPFLSQRIERLLGETPVRRGWVQSLLITWPVWGLLLYLLFFARFGA